MKSISAMSTGPSDCLGVALRTMWLVDQDESYQVVRKSRDSALVIVIRTTAGCGRIDIDGHGTSILTENTVFLADDLMISRYETLGPRWQFSWMVCAREGMVPYPWHEVLTVEPSTWEPDLIDHSFYLLSQEDEASRSAASALCNMLVHEWATRWRRNGEKHDPMREIVAYAAKRMQREITNPISVEMLARELGISARWMRQSFLVVTGKSPKVYYTEIRMRLALQMLQHDACPVNQVAERLGYSSPFHFSRAFKARFGCCPSAVRGGTAIDLQTKGSVVF